MQGSSSTWGEVHVGVPQGSILGRLLFSIYMNDLPIVTQNCELNLYADDMECTVVALIYLLLNMACIKILILCILGFV